MGDLLSGTSRSIQASRHSATFVQRGVDTIVDCSDFYPDQPAQNDYTETFSWDGSNGAGFI
jgi:hypothetical protein